MIEAEKFIDKKPEEEIKYTLRRHPFTFFSIVFLFSILFLIPVGLYFLISNIFPELLANQELVYVFLVLLCSIYYLSLSIFFFAQYIDFYLDLWVITSERIIDIEQFGLFSRSVSELDLYRIQDVTTDIHGVFPTILNYGNVKVKTASENVEIVFKNVPHPPEVRSHIIHLADLQTTQDKKRDNRVADHRKKEKK